MPPIAGAVGTRDILYGGLVRSRFGGSLTETLSEKRTIHWNKRADEDAEPPQSSAPASPVESTSTSSSSGFPSTPASSSTTTPKPTSSGSKTASSRGTRTSPTATPTSTTQTGGGSNATGGGKDVNNAASPTGTDGVIPTPSALRDNVPNTPIVTKTRVTLTSFSASTTISGDETIVTSVPVVFTSDVPTTILPEPTGTSLATTESHSSNKNGMIAGITIGLCALIALLLCAFTMFRRRRSSRVLPQFEEVFHNPDRGFQSLDEISYTVTPVTTRGSTNLVVPKVSVTDFPSPPASGSIPSAGSMRPLVPRIITTLPPSMTRVGNSNLIPPQMMQSESAITPASIFQVGPNGLPSAYAHGSTPGAHELNFRDSVPSEPDSDAYQSSPNASDLTREVKSSDPFNDPVYSTH